MKNKVTFLVCALCAMLMLAGCGKSPTKVVEKWHDAIIEQDLKTANEYCIGEMPLANSFLIAVVQKGSGKEVENFKSMKVVNEEKTGENAIVNVVNDNGDTAMVLLIKKNGKWKISNIKD